jgi:hypothetical protein
MKKTKDSIKTFNTAPEGSIILTDFGKVNYCDSYRVKKPAGEDLEKITGQIFHMPKWANMLMKIRHHIVRPFGLKTGKEIDAKIFPVIYQTEDEIVMGIDDKHLNFRVSILIDKTKTYIYTTTIVQYNNTLGKVYFFFIKPFHKLIVGSAMRKQMNRPAAER